MTFLLQCILTVYCVCIEHFAVFRVLCTIHFQCVVFSVHSALWTVYCAVWGVYVELCNVDCSLYTVQGLVFAVQSELLTVQWPFCCSVQC